MSKKIFSPKELMSAKIKTPSSNATTLIPDKDHGNRLTIVHDTGKTICLEEPKKVVRSSKDANSIFTVIEFFDDNNVLRKKSVLSKSGTSPNPDVYDVRTETFYNTSGVLLYTETYTLIYDVDGEWTSEVLA